MGDLGGKELEEAVELVGVAAHRRREARGVGLRGGLDRAHVELKSVAVALDAAEHAYRVALVEPPVEQVDSFQTRPSIRPLGSTSSIARYAEPLFVRSRRLRATAYTPSTTRSASSSAIVLTSGV